MTKEILRWQVGDVRITRVQELEAPDIRFVIPEATVENLAAIEWLGPFRAPSGHALASVHTLILEVGERRIVVDTCIGNDKPRRSRRGTCFSCHSSKTSRRRASRRPRSTR
jgi:hypothetical protein